MPYAQPIVVLVFLLNMPLLIGALIASAYAATLTTSTYTQTSCLYGIGIRMYENQSCPETYTMDSSVYPLIYGTRAIANATATYDLLTTNTSLYSVIGPGSAIAEATLEDALILENATGTAVFTWTLTGNTHNPIGESIRGTFAATVNGTTQTYEIPLPVLTAPLNATFLFSIPFTPGTTIPYSASSYLRTAVASDPADASARLSLAITYQDLQGSLSASRASDAIPEPATLGTAATILAVIALRRYRA